MRIVAALGGNALLKRGEPMTFENQRSNVRNAASALSELVKDGHELLVTHGNGPQIGMLALQAAAGPKDGASYPFDILGAESDGMIGYMIEQELRNCLSGKAQLATLLTQISVDPNDPAFRNPSKPVGPTYDEPTANGLAKKFDWSMALDGKKWRRIVPSPRPIEILEIEVIELLVKNSVIVICAGGGGIPVVKEKKDRIVGVDAVIDKDHASALLARRIEADILLLLTDVNGVYLDFGTARSRVVRKVGADRFNSGDFPPGSMRPKVEAAMNFASHCRKAAVIGRLEDSVAMVKGLAGTRIVPGNSALEFDDRTPAAR